MNYKVSNADLYITIDDEDYIKILSHSQTWCVEFRNIARSLVKSNNVIKVKAWSKILQKPVSLSHVVLDFPILNLGMVVDHINVNVLDNRKVNLRIISIRENNRNKIKQEFTSSKYFGVYFNNRGKWTAQLRVGNTSYTKSFETEYEAAKYSNELRKRFHGYNAILNDLN